MFHLNPKVSVEVRLYYRHATPFPYTVTETFFPDLIGALDVYR